MNDLYFHPNPNGTYDVFVDGRLVYNAKDLSEADEVGQEHSLDGRRSHLCLDDPVSEAALK